jgi:hypothetical protein
LQQALVQQYLGQAIQGLRSNAKIVQWGMYLVDSAFKECAVH